MKIMIEVEINKQYQIPASAIYESRSSKPVSRVLYSELSER